jgi:pimeloyl-ACP methyl ester carboxylesterase
MITLFHQKIEINGRKILCKVLSPTATIDNRPYMLCVPGGPGFGHHSMTSFINSLEEKARENHAEMPNVILYDPLGCGESDKAEDIVTEYCMNNFTEIAAKVVEAVKAKFCPTQQMDLRLYGGSFGAMTVMDLVMHRPEWLEESSDIRLRQIIASVLPNGVGDAHYTGKFIQDHFKYDVNYPAIALASYRLVNGLIKDQNEYIQTVVFLAPLYSADHARIAQSIPGIIIRHFHRVVIPIMRACASIGKFLGFNTEKLDFIIEGLTGCSLSVLNQFFKTYHSHISIAENVENNLEYYKKTQITMISCNRDHMANPKIAEEIHAMLPETSTTIILNESHQARQGKNKDAVEDIYLGTICQGKLTQETLEHKVVNERLLGKPELLRKLKIGAPKSDKSSTANSFKSLDMREFNPPNPPVVATNIKADVATAVPTQQAALRLV